jgi:hypothetical protein
MNKVYVPLREKLIAKAREQGSFVYSEIAPDLRLNMGLDRDRAELGGILGEISKIRSF